ncbi:hypothetical protein EDC56_2572 [Sinobacterium caligoides]|uniref:Uncharacterized protein n=1 Tax=Sinobacterium caligoides TaxID=933926 RepID=A0A3N2DJI7_9GAMM|nr:plasmid replication protein RepB [Sinobacterium caligoides]ROR99937.1 hypothetical protein EDC56_2572 [Sinobacterium caligoides]
MIISECAIYHSAGFLKGARIIPSPTALGWGLELVGRYKPFMVTRQRGGDCIYKSIDAAFAAATKIGFQEVTIESTMPYDA